MKNRLLIERYFAGELKGEDAERMKRTINEDPDAQKFFQTLLNEKDEFLDKHPFMEFKKNNLSSPQRNPEPSWWRKLLSVSAPQYRPVLVTATLLIVMAVVWIPQWEGEPVVKNQIRYKSPIELDFFYRRDGKIHQSDGGLRYREGDEIQFLYTPNRYKYLALFSVDQKGKVSFYHPGGNNDGASVSAQSGVRQPFPHSVVLDDSKGGELFIGKFSDKPLTRSQILSELKKLDSNFTRDIEGLHQKISAKARSEKSSLLSLMLWKE